MKIAFLLFFLLPFLYNSQIKIQILDSDSNEAVPAAELFYKTNKVAITDKNGNVFCDEGYDKLEVRARNYQGKEFILGKANNKIYITKIENILNEVAVKSGRDMRAIQLLQEVIKKQKENHPNQLDSYKFYAYNKFIADEQYDSIQYVGNPKTKEDSAHNKSKKLLEKSMNFIAERVTEHKYLKGKGEKKTLLADRISGIKTPLYEFAALQPISMYLNEDNFSFFIMKLPNPIAENNFDIYRYKISDTIQYNSKPTIVVRYFSKKKNDEIKKPLDGYIYIDKESKGITKFFGERVRKKNNTYIEIDWHQKENKWFPEKLFFKILTQGNKKTPKKDSIGTDKKVIRDSTNYVSAWVYNTTDFIKVESSIPLQKKEFEGYENDISKDAYSLADEVLKSYRSFPLSDREQLTYVKNDSIGKAENFDKNLKLLRLITTGNYEWKMINFKPLQFLSYNEYEGFRLKIAAETNYKFNEIFGINGYIAYGFKDKTFKGSVGVSLLANKLKYGKIFAQYTQDVAPAGRNYYNSISEKHSPIFIDNTLYNSLYFKYKKAELGYQQDFFRTLTATISSEFSKIQTKFGYNFLNQGSDIEYHVLNTSIQLKWAPFSKYITSPIGKMTAETKSPYFYFDYTKSWKTDYFDFDFHKVEFKAFYNFKNRLGNTFLNTNIGFLYGDTSLIYNFEGNGAANKGTDFWSKISLATNGFETMLAGEFFTDKYTSLFINHNFPAIKIGTKFINIQAQYKALFGQMENTGLHTEFSFKTPNKVFQEAGLELNNLFMKNFIGIGAYYRFGYYSLADFDKNLYIKMTIKIPFPTRN